MFLVVTTMMCSIAGKARFVHHRLPQRLSTPSVCSSSSRSTTEKSRAPVAAWILVRSVERTESLFTLPFAASSVNFSTGNGTEDESRRASPFKSPSSSADTSSKIRKRPRRKLIPKKYAITLTPKSRSLFKSLLDNAPEGVIGILFDYGQSKQNLGMSFTFGFARESDVGESDEGVTLEILPSGEPKSPADAQNDGLPKLYVSSDALLKVLGCTIDIDKDGISPLVFDAEGNKLDPNA